MLIDDADQGSDLHEIRPRTDYQKPFLRSKSHHGIMLKKFSHRVHREHRAKNHNKIFSVASVGSV